MPTKNNIFSGIGRTLTATSLGLQGKDPSDVFRDLDEETDKNAVGDALISQILGLNKGQATQQPQGFGVTPGVLTPPQSAINQAALGGFGIENITIPSSIGNLSLSNNQSKLNQAAEMEKVKKMASLEVPERLSESQIKDIQGDVDTLSMMTDNVLMLSANKEEFGDLLGPVGTMAPVRRFFSQFDEEGSGKAFVDNTNQSSQLVRKYITGVQGGYKEMDLIMKTWPSVKDKPDAFINKTYLSNRAVSNSISRQIPVLKALGKDTSQFEQILKVVDSSLEQIKTVMSPESIEKLETNFIEQMRSSKVPLVGEGITARSQKEAEDMSNYLPEGTKIYVGEDTYEVTK